MPTYAHTAIRFDTVSGDFEFVPVFLEDDDGTISPFNLEVGEFPVLRFGLETRPVETRFFFDGAELTIKLEDRLLVTNSLVFSDPFTNTTLYVPEADFDLAEVLDVNLTASNITPVTTRTYEAAGFDETVFPSNTPSDEFLVPTEFTADQVNPAVAVNGDRILVTWTDFSQALGDTGFNGVHAQVLDLLGRPVGDEFLVNTTVDNSQDFSAAAALGTGFVVAFADNSAVNGGADIKAQRLTADGVKVGPEFAVSTTNGDVQTNVAVASFGDSAVFVWEDFSGDVDGNVRARRFDSNGLAYEANDFLVHSITLGSQDNPSAAMTADGGFVVVWSDDPDPSLPAQPDTTIQMAIFDQNGQQVGGQINVSGAPTFASFPSVAVLGNGNIAVAWSESAVTRIRVLDATGAEVVAEFEAVPSPNGGEATLTALPDGGFYMTWVDGSIDSPGLFGQRFAADATPLDPPLAINQFDASLAPSIPRGVATLDDGRVFTAYADSSFSDLDDSGQAVLGRFIDPRGRIVVDGSDDDDHLVGDQLGNYFRARDGDDTIFGSAGADFIDGGDGFDTADYSTSGAAVTVSLSAASNSGGDAQGDRLSGIERIVGSRFSDTLTGGAANDTLDGHEGADLLAGMGGGDHYIIDNPNDLIAEAVGAGTDTAVTSVSYTLRPGVEVERLELSDPSATNARTLNGNGFSQTIVGNDGLNRIDGKGGGDVMEGRGGNDIYIVTNGADTIVELAGGGTADRALVHLNYALSAGAEVEFMEAADPLSATAMTLFGNAFGQTIIGNAGANRIDGKEGADTMQGLAGDDTYIVDHALDAIVEGAGGGTFDRVLTSVSFALTAGAQVERMDTLNATGTDALTLFGNEFGQTIYGNAGDNRLDGKGGADIMRGLAGNDIYYVDNSSDLIVEAVGDGVLDRVVASASYTLRAGVAVEQLITSDAASTAARTFNGNEFAQGIVGNAGLNRLDGKGGDDVLQGLGGPDIFVFSTALAPYNIDRIADFNAADDTIELKATIFSAISGTGTLSGGQFLADVSGVATSAAHRILYETDTGILSYDADGSGTGAAIQFATLSGLPAISNADFAIV